MKNRNVCESKHLSLTVEGLFPRVSQSLSQCRQDSRQKGHCEFRGGGLAPTPLPGELSSGSGPCSCGWPTPPTCHPIAPRPRRPGLQLPTTSGSPVEGPQLHSSFSALQEQNQAFPRTPPQRGTSGPAHSPTHRACGPARWGERVMYCAPRSTVLPGACGLQAVHILPPAGRDGTAQRLTCAAGASPVPSPRAHSLLRSCIL